jgi:pyruvate-formate lyase-activating enzyme
MADIIFYGAGEEARRKLPLLENIGLIPACFADADKEKHYTKIGSIRSGNEYDILPLNEALTHYPDCVIYLTVASDKWNNIRSILQSHGVKPENIKVHDGFQEYEWRNGCPHVGTFMMIQRSISTCCAHLYKEILPLTRYFDDDLAEYEVYCRQLGEKHKAESPTNCDGCVFLEYGYYSPNAVLRTINIGTEDLHYCNFECIYCPSRIKPNKTLQRHRTDYMLQILNAIKTRYNSGNTLIQYGNGELLANPYCNEIIDFFANSKIRLQLISNASVFNEKLVPVIQRTGSEIHASLDAGTRETFAGIKGVDLFEKVVANLDRYFEQGANISLKYIVLQNINDNHEEIDKFLNIVKRYNCPVYLSSDHFVRQPLPENTIESMIYFVKACRRIGLPNPIILREKFLTSDSQRIDEALK